MRNSARIQKSGEHCPEAGQFLAGTSPKKPDRYNPVSVVSIVAAVTISTVISTAQTGASRIALATVSDPRNRPLLDVSADDFVVQEAGAAREVLSVRPADYPIVLVVDTSSDARNEFPLIRRAALRFIERIGTRPLAVITCGAAPALVAGFDDDEHTVVAKLGALESDSNATATLLEAGALAVQTLRRTGTLFSAIVALSAATVDGSRGSPDEMLAAIADSGAILHIVANRSVQAMGGTGFRPGAALKAVAEQSRGEFTTIYSAASFQAALERLAERMTSEIMVEYIVPVGSKPNDVKLGIRVPGARVHGLGVAPR